MMKSSRGIFALIVLVLLGLSWISFLGTSIKEMSTLSQYTQKAEESAELGLYEQAIEYYKEALSEKNAKKYYLRIKELYDTFYAEEQAGYIRAYYIDDMLLAAEVYPKEELFWNTAIGLQLEAQDYKEAYNTVKRAMNRGAGGKQLDAYYKQLLYMEKVEYQVYNELKTALNGYNTVSRGGTWYVIDNNGEELTEQYDYVGLINDEGYGIYNTGKEIRLLDQHQIVRARFGNLKIDEAGYFSERSKIFPAKIGEKWTYINVDGGKFGGEFDIAGSFNGGKAVACSEGKWKLVSDNGDVTDLAQFTDIKLDLYDCHLQGGMVLAKENGKYHLYDSGFQAIGKFECDDIDLALGEPIAFRSGELWGFVDAKGKVLAEPQYKQAKSFSNGYAAVCGENGLWGFINDDYELVIDYKYVNAYYFTKDQTCFISQDGGTYQLMRFMFD